MSSADNRCKQFGPRSGPTKCGAWSGSKMFDTLMVFSEFYFEKDGIEKSTVSSADNPCKQFGPRSLISIQPVWHFYGISWKNFTKKMVLKNWQMQKKHEKLPNMQRVNLELWQCRLWICFEQIERLVELSSNLAIKEWRRLPRIVTHIHVPLLQVRKYFMSPYHAKPGIIPFQRCQPFQFLRNHTFFESRFLT